MNVGLNVAPRKTKNLFSAAFAVNVRTLPSPVFIDTVGACLSGFFAVSRAVSLVSLFKNVAVAVTVD